MSQQQLLENPFRLPPDEEIFLMREHQKRKREEEREEKKNQKVWGKKTASGRLIPSKRLRRDKKADGTSIFTLFLISFLINLATILRYESLF